MIISKCIMRYRLLLILLMLSPLWVKAQNLEDFKWQYRLLVINHDGQRGDMMHDIVAFNLDFACEMRERKILVVEYINGMHENLNAWPLDEEGIWLIGLDGGIKDYSQDTSILDRLFDRIDAMPMRRSELLRESECET